MARDKIRIASAAVFLITAFFKVHYLMLRPASIEGHDPVFSLITHKQLLGIAVLLELVAAAILLIRKMDPLGFALAAWLAASFLGYRALVWLDGASVPPCGCLGTAVEWLPGGGKSVDALSWCLILSLLCSNGFVLCRERAALRRMLAPQKKSASAPGLGPHS